MIKIWNKILSILLVVAMLFNSFSPLIVMAMDGLNNEVAHSVQLDNIEAKGNIEVELQLALPIRNKNKSNITLSVIDENNNKGSIKLDDVEKDQSGIYNTTVNIGEEQNIRVLITKRDFNGNVISGENEDNIVYYSINLYSLKTGKYTLEFSGTNFVTYSVPVTLKDFSKRVSLSNTAGLFEIGDVNHDNKVNEADEKIMIEAIENNDTSKDLNLDGVVDIADLNYITAVMNSSKGELLIEDTSAIMSNDNVAVELPQGTSIVEGSDISNIFIDSNEVVQLKSDSEGSISEDNPVKLALDLGSKQSETIEMSEIRIAVGQDNVPQKMKLYVEDSEGETHEYVVDNTTPKAEEGVHKFTDEVAEGTIKVDLGSQVAVKKVTIVITETSSNTLADIAKVEFLNNVKVETKEPEGFYTPQNIRIDDSKSEQLTIKFQDVPNVTGYEIEINGGTKNGVVFQTTFSEFTIEDLKNYVTYKIKVRSTNQEWRSGWSDEHEGTPKASGKAPKVDNVSATPGYGKITYSWKKMDDTTSYKLYWREKGTSVFNLVDNLTNNSYVVTGLNADTVYEAYVIGVNPIGESDSYTMVEARTLVGGAAIVPRYKLINDEVKDGKTVRVEEVHYTAGTMVNGDKYSMVDDDYNTYWYHSDWTISASNGYNTGTPVFVLDNKYKMDEFVLTIPDNYGAKLKSGGPNSNDIKVHYWADAHDIYDNKDRQEVPGTLTAKTDKQGRTYYLLKLEDPIEAKAVAFGLTVANNQRDIKIDEVKFYQYDSLVDEVAALFADDFRLTLKENVDQNKINELKARAEEQDHGEDNPYKESILADLEYAQKILNDEKIDDIITLNPNISNYYNNHVRFAMTISDYQPLGIVARPGEKLNVYVASDAPVDRNGYVTAELIYTQYHAEAAAWQKSAGKLKRGLNVIEIQQIGSASDAERGGSVYIRYTSTPNANTPIRVRVSGGTKIPMVDTTNLTSTDEKKNAIREYINELEAYNSKLRTEYKVYADENKLIDGKFDKSSSVLGSTEIVTKYGLFSVSSVAVEEALKNDNTTLEQKVNRLYESMEAFDEMMDFFYRQKGFIETDDTKSTDRMPKARINIRYMQMFYGAFMYAGGYHVGIEYGSIAGLVQASRNTDSKTGYFGWGISHEVGHQINLKDTVFAEVTNNIYALLAQTSNDHDESRLENQGYDKIYEKVTSHTTGRAQNVFVQLGMYWQLHLAYDEGKTFKDENSIYAKVNRIARNYKNENNYSRDELTILFASMATKKDLTDFFEAWGLKVTNDKLKKEIDSIEGISKETRAIYYLNDNAWRQKLAKVGSISEGAEILEASVVEASSKDKRVTINFNLNKDSDKILGFEILRNGVSIGFVENEDGVSSFVDNVGAENNRAYTYSVVAYDYYLNKTNEVVLPEVKIAHDGSVKKDAFTISSNVQAENEEVDYEDKDFDYSKLSVNNLIDGNINTGFIGTKKIPTLKYDANQIPSMTTDNGNAYVIINLNNPMSVSGIKYRALVTDGQIDPNTITKYKIYVSEDGENNSWKQAAVGTFNTSVGSDETLEDTIYFMKEGTDSKNQLWTYNKINYIKIESDSKTSLSGAEIDVIAPPGDNVDITTVGKLESDYCYLTDEKECEKDEVDKNGKVIGKKGVIKAGSVVIQGSYRGNPALNAILIGKANNETIVYAGEELIFATLNSDRSVYEVADGTWLYIMSKEEYEKMLTDAEAIRAYLYRVNDAETNDGQRLTSTSKTVNNLVPYDNLPGMQITDRR